MKSRRRFLFNLSAIQAAALSGAPQSAIASYLTDEAQVDSSSDHATTHPVGTTAQTWPDRIGSISTAGLLADAGSPGPSTWKASKHGLRIALLGRLPQSDPTHAFIEVFDRSNIDELIYSSIIEAGKAIQASATKKQFIYDPLLFDIWLKSVSPVLDRCLAYRNEMGALEATGVKAVSDYLNVIAVGSLQRQLIALSTEADSAALRQDYERRASKEYAESRIMEHIASAQSIEAEGSASEAMLRQQKEDRKLALLLQQFAINTESQIALFLRMVTPGTASNVAERYSRLEKLFAQDLKEAYTKVVSIALGVATVLGTESETLNASSMPLEVPVLNSEEAIKKWASLIGTKSGITHAINMLDAMVLYTRSVLTRLELAAQNEFEQTIPVLLNESMTRPGGAVGPLISDQQFRDMLATPKIGTLDFDFNIKQLSDITGLISLKNARVTGIGLAIVISPAAYFPSQYVKRYDTSNTKTPNVPMQFRQVDAIFYESRASTVVASILPPAQVFSDKTSQIRAPIVIPRVRCLDSSQPPEITSDWGARNLNPIGQWKLSIDRNELVSMNSYTSDEIDYARNGPEKWIKGFALFLRIRGTPVRV